YIIPFKKSREDAEQALAKTFKGKILLPKEFKDPANIQKVQGVYVPFWMFDSMIYVDAEYDGTRSTEYRDGDYIVKETDHYDIYRQADVYFNMVPADASSKMPDELMDAIEPYYYGDMVTFSKGYLPGYLADKYDIDVADVKWKATKRMDNTAGSYVRASIFGYDFVHTERYNSSVTHNKISYAMLPVWILKTKWQEKSYLFAMNGQTGKMIGDLPISEKRFWLFLGAVALVAALILFVCGAGYKILENANLGSAENCRTLFAVLICMGFGFIAGLIAALAARTGMKTAGLAKKADNYLNGQMSSITYRSDEFSHTEVSRTYSPENHDDNNNNHRY
ncbi:MAG: hypothetical protein HUJ75_07280, partial [Parasporobacterium sp.]|nr:hypothetical protein [Parasporobacterium sp.]